jgi:hypothetical protein
LCGGFDIAADNGLTQERDQAALGLPALILADVNEVVGVGWCDGDYSSIRC